MSKEELKILMDCISMQSRNLSEETKGLPLDNDRYKAFQSNCDLLFKYFLHQVKNVDKLNLRIEKTIYPCGCPNGLKSDRYMDTSQRYDGIKTDGFDINKHGIFKTKNFKTYEGSAITINEIIQAIVTQDSVLNPTKRYYFDGAESDRWLYVHGLMINGVKRNISIDFNPSFSGYFELAFYETFTNDKYCDDCGAEVSMFIALENK